MAQNRQSTEDARERGRQAGERLAARTLDRLGLPVPPEMEHHLEPAAAGPTIGVQLHPGTPKNYLPEYAHLTDAGADVRTRSGFVLDPGARVAAPTGLYLTIPAGWEVQVRPRSGLALRNGITVLNAPGTVDPGYTGEVQVIVVNHSTDPFIASPGDRIAQLVVQPVHRATFRHLGSRHPSRQATTDRGSNGFGSTGTR